MTFEEKFPGFTEYLGDHRVICVTLSEVEKHCLDKSVVKNAIEKAQKLYTGAYKDKDLCYDEWDFLLLKELGLD